jgi:hypothetical protein
MGAAFNRLSFCPRDSKRLQVTPVHDAIRADELWLETAIKAGLVLAEMDRGIVEGHGFRSVYRWRGLPTTPVTVSGSVA